MRIRELCEPDRDEWLRMRRALWPELPPTDLEAETGDYFSRGVVWDLPTRVLVVETSVLPAAEGVGASRGHPQAAMLAGFVEVSLRQTAAGCSTSPVGYIEAWYVDPGHRRKGLGRALVEAAEAWAREQGCVEMGSDCDADNVVSFAAHQRMGYRPAIEQVPLSKRLALPREDDRHRDT